MSVSGYLVPFPDPGAADLMSNHLEQVVQATGPGRIVVRTSLPGTSTGRAARKRLEFFRLDGADWVFLRGTTSDSDEELAEAFLDVQETGTVRCTLTNMSGREGQFFLDCSYEPGE